MKTKNSKLNDTGQKGGKFNPVDNINTDVGVPYRAPNTGPSY